MTQLFVKVLLVTAGYDDGDNYLSSTEVQLDRSSQWREVQPYPLSVYGLSGATIDNEMMRFTNMRMESGHWLEKLRQIGATMLFLLSRKKI